jgi:ABC-type bacteriocin/lantibiotic exporter with double-glycine peptidase domain
MTFDLHTPRTGSWRAWIGAFAGAFLTSSMLLATIPSSRVLLEVPFYPDKTDQCGPATLAGVLSYWGKSSDPVKLRQEMYLAKLQGTLPMDLVAAAESYGLHVKMVAGNIDQIRSELRQGRPVLAMLNLGYSFMPVGHYVIVTGFDDQREGFYIHSAGKPNRFISYKKFGQQWRKTDYWAMLTEQA